MIAIIGYLTLGCFNEHILAEPRHDLNPGECPFGPYFLGERLRPLQMVAVPWQRGVWPIVGEALIPMGLGVHGFQFCLYGLIRRHAGWFGTELALKRLLAPLSRDAVLW